MNQLWPSLESIQATLSANASGTDGYFRPHTHLREGRQSYQQSVHHFGHSQPGSIDSGLAELSNENTWTAGSLITVVLSRGKAGVLLDQALRGNRWSGWLTAPETCWASAFDVLLEPLDVYFDPQFSMIQTWNRVELECSASIKWQQGDAISIKRLTAIRAVAHEYTSGFILNIPPELARIALRPANSSQMVLTGTPLGLHDPRRDYQAMYKRFAAKLMAAQLTHRVTKRQADSLEVMTDKIINKPFDFRVKLKSGVLMMQSLNLLRVTFSFVVSGPDQDNCYAIKSSHPEMARTIFEQSILIEKIFEA